MSRSRLKAEIAFFCTLPCQPTERSEARRGSAQLSLIGGARAAPIKLNWLISQPDRRMAEGQASFSSRSAYQRLLSRENRRHEKKMSFYFLFMLRIAVGSNALDRRTVTCAERSVAHGPLIVLIDGKFSIYYPYSMESFPSLVILQHKKWKNSPQLFHVLLLLQISATSNYVGQQPFKIIAFW